MSYQALARKWRPRSFQELVGQAHVVTALTNALDADRVHHAFLFTGTRGVGKTTVARILAKCLNCESGPGSTPCGECSSCCEIDEGRHVDLIEVDAASRAKVDETRELMNNVQFAPTRARFKVYLIDEVHMFSDASFNALLKTLEEPPEHVKFLLATTDPQRMPVTVLSRCLQFSLKRLPVELIVERVESILDAEGVTYDGAGVRAIARAADGSLRDALSLLDQAIVHGGGAIGHEQVNAMLGLMDRAHIQALVSRLGAGDGAGLLAQVEAMAGDVVDWGEALSELLFELKGIALAQLVPEAHSAGEEPALAFQREMAEQLPAEDVQLYYQIGLIGRRDLPLAPDPRSGFEMTLLRMLAFRPDDVSVGAASGGGGRSEPAPAPRARAVEVAEPPASASASSASAANDDAQRSPRPIDRDWVAIATGLKVSGLARELALNAECRRMDASSVLLRVSPEHAALAEGRHRDKLASALGDALGHSVTLAVEVADPEHATPAQVLADEQAARTAQAADALERDPGVRALMSTFDAQIQPESIRPADEAGAK